jgi:nucleoside-diphosphate-sugar epimerase
MSGDFVNKKVLVTGSSGFIGSHITQRMVKENATVTVLARETSDLWRLENIRNDIAVFRVDIRDYEQLNNCICRLKPDYVFHMAAYGVDSRQKDWFVAAQTNILGTVNLIKSLKQTGCVKFLNIGSCMEYGDKKEIVREDATLEPFNIYGSTKAAATIMAHQLAAENGIDIVTLRAFGIFGENEGSHKFFPHIILSLLNGSAVNLTACEQYRDYCYIDNIIDGFILAATDKKSKNTVFNIGSGTVHQLHHYVDMVYMLMNNDTKPNYGAVPYRPDEVWKPHPDTGKIRKMLKWEPKVPLEEGLNRTIAWYEKNTDKYFGTGR